MRTTIDHAGRVVIPKPVRDEAGLSAGTEVDVRFRDGRVELEPASIAMRLVKHGHGATVVADDEVPTLTAADVRTVLEHIRR